MLQYTMDSCVPKFKNCAAAALGEQPSKLALTKPIIAENGTVIQPEKYYCQDCFEGFYWNEELEIC